MLTIELCVCVCVCACVFPLFNPRCDQLHTHFVSFRFSLVFMYVRERLHSFMSLCLSQNYVCGKKKKKKKNKETLQR